MKKLFLMLVLAGAATLSFTSCGKGEPKPAIEQKFTVELSENQSYTFTLPDNTRHDVYAFTSQALHSSTSILSKNASGAPIYQYTPALNYKGTDDVVVSNCHAPNGEHQGPPCCHPGHQGCCPHNGGCCGGDEDHYMVTIHFVVGQENATSSR